MVGVDVDVVVLGFLGLVLNGLDLFSGIGGMSLALREWVRPIAYCECDPYCQAVLLSRMDAGQIVNAPIWDDVRTLGVESGVFPRRFVDCIYGGFPCQDISIAGAGRGLDGERSGLFFEVVRLAKQVEPSWIFLENVPAITSRGGLRVVGEITELGYDCRWCVISAASVGAPHKRERWFLLAHSDSNASERKLYYIRKKNAEFLQSKERRESASSEFNDAVPEPSMVAHTKSSRWLTSWDAERVEARQPESAISDMGDHWSQNEPGMVGVVDGVPRRMDRTKALGNAVVPEQARQAFKLLMGL